MKTTLRAIAILLAVLVACTILVYIGTVILPMSTFTLPLGGGGFLIAHMLEMALPPLIVLSGLEALLLRWLTVLRVISRPWGTGLMWLCLGSMGLMLSLYIWGFLKYPSQSCKISPVRCFGSYPILQIVNSIKDPRSCQTLRVILRPRHTLLHSIYRLISFPIIKPMIKAVNS